MSGFLQTIFGRTEKRGDINTVLLEAGFGQKNTAGVSVTPKSAMRYAAVYACVRILSETIASLPIIFYERQERGRKRVPDFYLYLKLHDLANPLMTAFQFKEVMQASIELWGNGYAQIIYDTRGRVTELWPLRPDRMLETKLVNGRRYYLYQTEDKGLKTLTDDVVWHIPGLGYDGLNGYSPITLMRQAIGLGLAAEEFGARFFGNDARPGIVFEHPGALKDTAYKNIKNSWNENHQGVSKSHLPDILEEGMKLHEIGIPPEDAQFLQTREFQIVEIARIFRVPPHLLADLSRATFSNIEHQSIDFVVHSIRPRVMRWEQSIQANLMLESERKRIYCEFLVDGLLRGDIQSRYTAYATARQNGWMSANDIRELENQNPVEGGDVYLVPLNMVPADQVANGGTLDASSDNGAGLRANIEARTDPGGAEERAVKAARSRHRLVNSYRRIYRDTAARILRREANDIRAQAQKMLGKRNLQGFESWLSSFYQEHSKFIQRQMGSLTRSYSDMVMIEVEKELGKDLEVDADNFTRSYLETYAGRHIGLSQLKIQRALENAAKLEADLLEAVEDELDNWETARAEEVAGEEAVRTNNAFAKLVYVSAGVKALRSVAFGDSCPYCKNLNGRVVSIEQNFINAGEDFKPEGAETPLVSSINLGHSPYHRGCDCMNIANL